jgi:Luciferase-like monooxygenase
VLDSRAPRPDVIEIPCAPGPLPLARARNTGAQHALRTGAELLIFLDVDCIPGSLLVRRYLQAAASESPSFGFFASSEELGPDEIIRAAKTAEAAGFNRLWVSDHYHPWMSEQGSSPFVWSVLGALASTTQLKLTTAVTCPTFRIHPAIIAQATATTAVMAPGRFTFRVGTGEALLQSSDQPPGSVVSQCLHQLRFGHLRAALDADFLGPLNQVLLAPVVIGAALAALAADLAT